jgi:chromosome partitioning protein
VKHVPRSKIVFALCRVGSSDAEITDARHYLNEAGYEVLEGALPEQVAYRRASDEGRAATETRFTSLNKRAEILAQSIVNKIATLTSKKKAR